MKQSSTTMNVPASNTGSASQRRHASATDRGGASTVFMRSISTHRFVASPVHDDRITEDARGVDYVTGNTNR